MTLMSETRESAATTARDGIHLIRSPRSPGELNFLLRVRSRVYSKTVAIPQSSLCAYTKRSLSLYLEFDIYIARESWPTNLQCAVE